MSRRRARTRPGWQTWLGRGLLLWLGLEVGLRIPMLPPWWEAGIWSGNILSDRLSVKLKTLTSPGGGVHNPQGYRDRAWTTPAARPRLVAMGDSRVFGHYVQPHEAFPQVLHRSSGWDVANLGLPGASVVEALDFILDDALALRPQAALVCYDINSSLYGVMSREAAGGRDDWGVQLARSSALVRWLELGLRAALVARHPVMPVDRYQLLLERLLERLEQGGAERRIVVVGWTELENYPTLFTRDRYERFRQASRDAAAADGATVVEMEAVFAGVDTDSVFLGEERMHLSPWANGRMAEAIQRALGPPP